MNKEHGSHAGFIEVNHAAIRGVKIRSFCPETVRHTGDLPHGKNWKGTGRSWFVTSVYYYCFHSLHATGNQTN